MVLATGEKTVAGFIEFELIKLAERINVSGNLTDSQIEFIASQLLGMYPNETIADFKICFEKGASGAYGKIFKLDGVEVGQWMKLYLDEKYQVMENQLMKEKDEIYKKPVQNQDWLQLWKEAIEKTEQEGATKTTKFSNEAFKKVRDITNKEIEAEGKDKPLPKSHSFTSEGDIIQHNERMRKWQEATYRERHPSATEEEVAAFLESIKPFEAKTKI